MSNSEEIEVDEEILKRHFRVSAHLRSKWENFSDELKTYFADTFTRQIKAIYSGQAPHLALRYPSTDDGKWFYLGMEFERKGKNPEDFCYVLTEIEPVPEDLILDTSFQTR